MAWESRGTGQYYYRKRKVGGRVVAEYVGNGLYAHLAQLQDDAERIEAQERRQAWQAVVDADKELDAQLDHVTELVNAYAGALMLASGYYQHRRQWRKKQK